MAADLPGPDLLLKKHESLFRTLPSGAPILDLACGDGHNGIFLAGLGFQVILADSSGDALKTAQAAAVHEGVASSVRCWEVDLEKKDINPFENLAFSAIVVFRYLHRPLIACIRKSLLSGGVLLYETFTGDQARFGKPRNPAHLLRGRELLSFFGDWEIVHFFEGIEEHPSRAISQIVCRKR